MRVVGAPSWSLNVTIDPLPFALRVRDAVRLDTSSDDLSPPALVRPPADLSALLTPAERADARTGWSGWWRDVVRLDGRTGTGRTGDALAWHRTRSAERAAVVGEPPDFDALAVSPGLRRAAVEVHRRDRRGDAPSDNAQSDDEQSGDEPFVDGELAREIVGDVAARHGVPLHRVRGVVLAYPVQGLWWRVAGPGLVTCSTACLRSEDDAAGIVRTAFESSLTG